jgi:hypothetical protein
MPLAFTFSAPWESESAIHTGFAFLGGHQFSGSTIALQLAELARDPKVERIAVIAPSFLGADVAKMLVSADFRERLPRRLQANETVRDLSIQTNGTISTGSAANGNREAYQNAAPLFNTGMRHIFFKYAAVLDGERRYHFRKPSGAHSDRFIRVAQVLNDSVELEFVAASLLQYLNEDVHVISCDTPSIATVAYAAIRLRERLVGSHSGVQVDTFHSYEFVRDGKGVIRADTLYVISATASADLASRFIKQGATNDQVVTLYSVGTQIRVGQVLCDLTKRDGDSTGVPAIVNYDGSETCPMCEANIPIVDILGDQFLPIQTTVERVRPIKSDAPAWLSNFIDENRGLGIFACHFGKGTLGRVHDIWIHVDQMMRGNNAFRQDLARHLYQTIPACLSRIIYVGDDVSEQLACIAQHFYFQRTQHHVPVESIGDAYRVIEKSDGAILVVTSAVSSGRSILNASQLLRDIQTDGKIVFLIALLRTRTREEARRVRNNLVYTPSRNYRFAIHVIEEVYFPDNTRRSVSSWTEELQFLKTLMLEEKPFETDTERQIQDRINLLQESLGSKRGGLRDDAFWPAPTSESLRLRSGFSLFGFDYADKRLTQADVFATVAALFQRMRLDPFAKQSLMQMPYRRAVFDPEVFSQFNDGIVQAAVLRAAKSPELDYSIDVDASCEMAGVLENILQSSHEPNGEACVEFLLALCMKRLRVLPQHLQPILEAHLERANKKLVDVELSAFLLKKIG